MRLVGDIDSANEFLREWHDDSMSYIVAHTSGSTGAPKRIDLLKSDMRASAFATCSYFNIGRDSRLLLPLSVSYIAGKMMVVRTDIADAELVVESPSNTPLKSDYGTIDLIAVVPSQLPSLISNPLLHCVRNVIVGGAPIPLSMERHLLDLPTQIYATYGMTETCSHVALRNVSRGDDCYHALSGITFDVDQRGCLIINTPQFSFSHLVTNDVVELCDSVSFRWLGRADNVINSGGVKLHPELIERKIGKIIELPFYLMGQPSARWGEELVMYVEGDQVDVSAIEQLIAPSLDRYEMPKKIMAVRRFERTAGGKVLRKKLN